VRQGLVRNGVRASLATQATLLTDANVSKVKALWALHTEYGHMKRAAMREMRSVEARLRETAAPLFAKRTEILRSTTEDLVPLEPKAEQWEMEVIQHALRSAAPSPSVGGYFWRDVISAMRLGDDDRSPPLNPSDRDLHVLGFVVDVRLATRVVQDAEKHDTLEIDFDDRAPVEPKTIRATFVRDLDTDILIKSTDVVAPLFLDDVFATEEDQSSGLGGPGGSSNKRLKKFQKQRGTAGKKNIKKTAGKPHDPARSFFAIFQTVDDWYGDVGGNPEEQDPFDSALMDDRNFLASIVQDLERIVPDAVEVFIGMHLQNIDPDDEIAFAPNSFLNDKLSE